MPIQPDESAVRTIIKNLLQNEVTSITRFPTGLDNYVYKVILENNTTLVARLNTVEKVSQYEAALYWHQKLQSANIPMPKLIAANTAAGTIPYMLLEYKSASDLGDIYHTLTPEQRENLAKQIATIQINVATKLPMGKAYGFADSYEDPTLLPTWVAVLHKHLDRSRNWINEVGLADPDDVEKVREKLTQYGNYFNSVKPVPFLHDTTTKNVLVADAKIVAIVDIDSICFGDLLFVPALTKMALLSMEQDLGYITAWCKELKITTEQYQVLDLYTAMFCVNFMGEIGKSFNKENNTPAKSPENLAKLTKLKSILNTILEK